MQHLNSQYHAIMQSNGSIKANYLSDYEDTQHDLEKKLVHMAKIFGEYLESINFKKYNNSESLNHKNHGKCTNK